LMTGKPDMGHSEC
ncbi:unnamed protein product, partial [Allacma fusca]